MQDPSPNLSGYRFGVLEVDLRAGEIRKNGLKIKLQEQPFQVLTFLLQNSPNMVAREDLRKRLWDADTFVEFDHGLSNAIGRIREALSDSADNARFIETLPKRGYRFIVPVEEIVAAQVLRRGSTRQKAMERNPRGCRARQITHKRTAITSRLPHSRVAFGRGSATRKFSGEQGKQERFLYGRIGRVRAVGSCRISCDCCDRTFDWVFAVLDATTNADNQTVGSDACTNRST